MKKGKFLEKRNTLVFFSIWVLLATGAFWSGYEDNANGSRLGDWTTWNYWRYFLAGFLPIIGLLATWVLLYDSAFGRPLFLAYYVVNVVIMGFLCLYVVWEIVVWTRCDDRTGSTPDYPHCINRFYPTKSYPDTNFFLTFVGGATNLALTIIFFVWVSQSNTLQASRTYSAFGYETIQSKMGDVEAAPDTVQQLLPAELAIKFRDRP